MLVDRILRNLDDAAPAAAQAPGASSPPARPEIDWLDLTWRDCARRSFRKRTRGGREVRVLLPPGTRVRHRDVLIEPHPTPAGVADAPVVAVNLRLAELRVAAPASPADLARLALELGNLHVPVQVRDDTGELLLLPDGPTDALLARLGIPTRIESHRFTPEPCSIRSLPAESVNLSITRSE
jgi:urease accessory protein UreE